MKKNRPAASLLLLDSLFDSEGHGELGAKQAKQQIGMIQTTHYKVSFSGSKTHCSSKQGSFKTRHIKRHQIKSFL